MGETISAWIRVLVLLGWELRMQAFARSEALIWRILFRGLTARYRAVTVGMRAVGTICGGGKPFAWCRQLFEAQLQLEMHFPRNGLVRRGEEAGPRGRDIHDCPNIVFAVISDRLSRPAE